MLPEGKYRAVCKSHEFSETAKGKEFLLVEFEVVDEPHHGTVVEWKGWFSEKGLPITERALKAMGWDGGSLKSLGMLPEVVTVEVKHEEYEGKTSAKVAFVNAPRRPLAANKLDELERRRRERDPGNPFE